VIDLREMVSLYAQLHETEPYRDMTVSRDISYGPDMRHRADLFVAAGGDGPRPVLVFVHGGGYIAGDRRVRPGSPFYDNVALWAARKGFLAVNISYRLAPGASWPAVQEDIALALRWLGEHAAGFGGDPDSILLMGHSAGATHIACVLGQGAFFEDFSAVRAAILLSATTQATADADIGPEDAPFIEHERAYFGQDPSRYAATGALPGLLDGPVPVLLVSPEFDPSFFKRHHEHIARILDDGDSIHRSISLAGHNHMSQIFSLNTRDTCLGEAILVFAGKALGAAPPSGWAKPARIRLSDGAR